MLPTLDAPTLQPQAALAEELSTEGGSEEVAPLSALPWELELAGAALLGAELGVEVGVEVADGALEATSVSVS